MKIAQLKKAMKENMILSQEEAESAIQFVEDLLFDEIKETKEEYPNATRTISELEIARQRVTELYHAVGETTINE